MMSAFSMPNSFMKAITWSTTNLPVLFVGMAVENCHFGLTLADHQHCHSVSRLVLAPHGGVVEVQFAELPRPPLKSCGPNLSLCLSRNADTNFCRANG